MKLLFGHVALCSRPDEMEIINDENISGAIWDRKLNDELERQMRQLRVRLKNSKDLATNFWPESPVPEIFILEHLKKSYLGGYIKEAGLYGLASDIKLLADLFARISGKTSLSVNLDYSTKNGLGNFHVDNPRLRLVTTYFGLGSQWLPNQILDLDALVKKGDVIYPLNNYQAMIQTVQSGQVLILKGRDSYDSGGLSLAHGVPVTSESRFRLMIN